MGFDTKKGQLRTTQYGYRQLIPNRPFRALPAPISQSNDARSTASNLCDFLIDPLGSPRVKSMMKPALPDSLSGTRTWGADVSVHGLFGKTGKSDLALVERIGDNILYVA